MAPMTSPDSTYCERRYASTLRAGSALGRHHQVARLEIGREDDLCLGEGLLRLGVLQEQDGRAPLLPVRPLAVGEGDGAVPTHELVAEKRLEEIVRLVALGRGHGVREEHDLGVGVEGAVDRLLLELVEVASAEGLPSRSELHGRVVVDDEGGV